MLMTRAMMQCLATTQLVADIAQITGDNRLHSRQVTNVLVVAYVIFVLRQLFTTFTCAFHRNNRVVSAFVLSVVHQSPAARRRLPSPTDFDQQSAINKRFCLLAACFCLARLDFGLGKRPNRDCHGNRRHGRKNSVKNRPTFELGPTRWVNRLLLDVAYGALLIYWSVRSSLYY